MREFPKVEVSVDVTDQVIDPISGNLLADCAWVTDGSNVARRIAAALNATRHLDTEELEAHGLKLHNKRIARDQRHLCVEALNEQSEGFQRDFLDSTTAIVHNAPEPKEATP